MIPIQVLLLLQDYMYFEDFKSLSDAYYITTPTPKYLMDKYCKLDIPHKLEYLIDRLSKQNMSYVYCKSALDHNAYGCINMLLRRSDRNLLIITYMIYDYNLVHMLDYLKSKQQLKFCNTLSLTKNNRVLEALVDLYADGTLYKSDLYYELDQLGRYDLLDKIQHVYYGNRR